MSDSEMTPPVDDFKDVDTAADYMLNKEDDFKVDPALEDDDVEDVVVEAVPTTIDVSVELKSDLEPIEIEPPSENVPSPDSPMFKEMRTVLNPVAVERNEIEALASVETTESPLDSNEALDIVIQVSDPHKVGDGMMNSYMTYKVMTKTSLQEFKSSEMKVDRRFSDFLGLHEKLIAKHRHVGKIVPPAPEKNIVGMTLVKMSKTDEEAVAIDFVEKRRASLERYLNRLVRHAPLAYDQDLHDFLEQPTLPQATNTRALSGAGMMRLVKNMEGAINKITIKMVEEDPWFEEKQQQIESLESHVKRLHDAFESLVHHRKELAVNTAVFAKSAASLGNAEEHTSLSRALAQLSDSFEKLENQHQEQANKDYFFASETLADYLHIIEEIKEIFMVRVKSWQNWKTAEQNVQRKREAEMKMQASGRSDKLSQIKAEIEDLNERVETCKKDFEQLSAQIKKDIGIFEKDRIVDFQQMVLIFLKNLMKSQEQNIKNWEAFLPEARAIA